ncbi:MAG TPA: hypothetical protein PKB11_05495 [Desulfovibrio sp.]|uniref:hypothetical protein n=1 Tax=Desulfovibrio sp. TaxID=885 RepID=UPI002CD78BAF|nr:hypothetical protein [Desulfovibrio sp.]HMM38193.1 hypothetical protein [Desulfovibrio sp.]
MSTQKPGTPSPRRRLRLTSVDAVRGYLAGCLQRLENGELDENGTKARCYCAQALVRIIEGSDLEKRLEALEAQAKENRR